MKTFYALSFGKYINFKIEAPSYKIAQGVPKQVYLCTYAIRVVSPEYVKKNKLEWFCDVHPSYYVREDGSLSAKVHYATEKAYFEAFDSTSKRCKSVTYSLSKDPKERAAGVLVANLSDYDYENMVQHEYEDGLGCYFFRVYPGKRCSESVFEYWQEVAHGEFD